MRFVWCMGLLFFVAACATHRGQARLDREEFFPTGTYRHEVEIEFEKQKPFRFQGVIRLTEKEIQVIGLSSFQTTIFRITDHRLAPKPHIEIFHDALRGKEKYVEEFYGLLREMLLYSHRQNQERAFPSQIQRKWKGETVLMEFLNYDSNQLPRLIRMQHPKFRVEARVVDYEI